MLASLQSGYDYSPCYSMQNSTKKGKSYDDVYMTTVLGFLSISCIILSFSNLIQILLVIKLIQLLFLFIQVGPCGNNKGMLGYCHTT